MAPAKILIFRVFFVGVLCLSAASLATVEPLFAQENSGSLNGTVSDESGGVMRGVKVMVTNKITNRSISGVTGSDLPLLESSPFLFLERSAAGQSP